MRTRPAIAAVAALTVFGGCAPRGATERAAVEVPVVLWFDEFHEVMSGQARRNHFLESLSIDLTSHVNPVRCVGRGDTRIVPPESRPPQQCDGVRGDARLTCSDGRELELEWRAGEHCGSGYGKGADARGHTFHLAYGGSRRHADAIVREVLAELAGKAPLPAEPEPADAKPSVSTGTAFFVSWEGHLVTNHHVVGRAQSVRVKLDDHEIVEARVIELDATNDLAILQVEAIREPLRVLGEHDLVKGQEVFTLGYPLIALQGQEQKATFGHVNALSGYQGDARFTQIDVPIQPGNSGGPLLNRRGEVVGVVTSMLHPMAAMQAAGVVPQNVNYALKSDYAASLLERLAQGDAKALTREPGPAGGEDHELAELVRLMEDSVVLVVAQ